MRAATRSSSSIRSQGKLTDELEGKIAGAVTKAELEDIYLPYKPKRRTKAEIARERGLGPLAETILSDRRTIPSELAKSFLTDDVPDVKAALEGARDILVETFSENADLVGRLRNYMKDRAVLRAKVVDGKQEAGAKFSDYFNHFERWATVPSHRALAMLRGRNEEVLSLDIEVDAEDTRRDQAGRAHDRRRLCNPGRWRCRRQLADGGGALDLAYPPVAQSLRSI